MRSPGFSNYLRSPTGRQQAHSFGRRIVTVAGGPWGAGRDVLDGEDLDDPRLAVEVRIEPQEVGRGRTP
jgi:hypothetical protein